MKGELYLMDENGEPVKKIGRFSEMKTSEVIQDPRINLKKMYESKYEGTIELTPESEAQLAELQKKLDAEIVENLKQQIEAVDNVILGLKSCDVGVGCTEKCPYYAPVGSECYGKLYKDAIAIAEAYKRVIESGLQMMEERE